MAVWFMTVSSLITLRGSASLRRCYIETFSEMAEGTQYADVETLVMMIEKSNSKRGVSGLEKWRVEVRRAGGREACRASGVLEGRCSSLYSKATCYSIVQGGLVNVRSNQKILLELNKRNFLYRRGRMAASGPAALQKYCLCFQVRVPACRVAGSIFNDKYYIRLLIRRQVHQAAS